MARLEPEGWDLVGIRAGNPGPLTLTGTNSWLVGRDPAWLIDPGPALADHLEALEDEIRLRGGLGGIALTHDHIDHTEAVPLVSERHPSAALAAARGRVDVQLADGDSFGPMVALSVPGHSPDHLVYVWDGAAFTGDAVLGQGSVFIAPDPGALRGYLNGLSALRLRPLELILPGHGPVVDDPAARLDHYISHRLERERRLLDALAAGKRSVDELLDEAWSEVPAALRPPAALTLAAHLDKLADEGRLPDGVQRPSVSGWPRH